MEKLKELISKCGGSVSININEHKDCYETVEQSIKNKASCSGTSTFNYVKEEIGIDVYNKMVEKDYIIDIYFHPNNSVGFYNVTHYDLDMCIDKCLTVFK